MLHSDYGRARARPLACVFREMQPLTAQNRRYLEYDLYYNATGERLSPGYADFPPFVALATAFARATLGDSPLGR